MLAAEVLQDNDGAVEIASIGVCKSRNGKKSKVIVEIQEKHLNPQGRE